MGVVHVPGALQENLEPMTHTHTPSMCTNSYCPFHDLHMHSHKHICIDAHHTHLYLSMHTSLPFIPRIGHALAWGHCSYMQYILSCRTNFHKSRTLSLYHIMWIIIPLVVFLHAPLSSFIVPHSVNSLIRQCLQEHLCSEISISSTTYHSCSLIPMLAIPCFQCCTHLAKTWDGLRLRVGG